MSKESAKNQQESPVDNDFSLDDNAIAELLMSSPIANSQVLRNNNESHTPSVSQIAGCLDLSFQADLEEKKDINVDPIEEDCILEEIDEEHLRDFIIEDDEEGGDQEEREEQVIYSEEALIELIGKDISQNTTDQ